ncbi:Gfo/Idh/MocA family protein [Pseudarthrobacter sp. NamE5]|uniref:Gfo/Idh/MocA family protein n=1 Tax=Pseudarthrobacter sp. NamE5 TaxID=2576839 RepID=UPI00110C05A4|nr:Gfo/Idh/MocA family oxidoreductase [Pseudarthrobacter sp. NamE5]TLM82494.1 Gfo/Idh/MocA family oxidoreductase [Pseudarthrobacter sp. NamE5]
MPQLHRPLKVALVGYSFMGSIHAQAWATAPRFFDLGVDPELAVVCGRSADAAGSFARKFLVDRVETDWRKVVTDPEVDVVDICTPGKLHSPIALAALEAGKHVLCEKPLANSLEEARQMTMAAENAATCGVKSMVGFSYRRTPALAYAKQLVDNGSIGTIRHVRAAYLQDWITDEDFPLVWRLDREQAGTGALGDLGAHIIDLAQHLTGHKIAGVSALTETFVPTRPLPSTSGGLSGTSAHSAGTAERGEVTVDDAAIFLARTDRGALATFEATRFASGRKNALRIEVNGSKGSFAFDFEALNELEFYDNTQPTSSEGFRRILVTEPEHPYAGAWWPAGHGLGYDHTFVHQIADFVRCIAQDKTPSPSFRDGLQVQQVLAAVEASAAGQQWQPVGHVPATA